MTVCRCRVCGEKQITRSVFEVDCDACGAEEALVAEDAYDPEPEELRCSSCGWEVAGGGLGDYGNDYAGALSVDDPCPRCRGVLVPKAAWRGSTGAALEQPEYALARAAARDLLDDHWTGEMPVDLDKLAHALGLHVRRGPFNHQGLLKDGVIEVPETEAATAQRFAVAHELGHHQLRHRVPEERIEAEANAFASELLMPRHRLKRAVEVGLSLGQLRAHFAVSGQALHWALEQERLLDQVSG
jgi:hypothetical protein